MIPERHVEQMNIGIVQQTLVSTAGAGQPVLMVVTGTVLQTIVSAIAPEPE